MTPIPQALAAFFQSLFRSRLAMQAEILALRHQLGVYQRTCRRPRLKPADRMLWAWLSRAWPVWRDALVIVQPESVIAWRRRRFREYWTRLTGSGKPGRPAVPREIRDLIRKMSAANPLWGSLRIVGELGKIGIDLPRSTVAKYMIRRRRPPSGTRPSSSSSCLLTNDDASSTSTSPHIRPPSGPPSRSSRLSRGTRHHSFCCEIAMESTATTSAVG